MSALDRACAEVVAAVDGALGCAILALPGGEALGAHGEPAALDLAGLAALAGAAREAAGVPASEVAFDELLVSTPRISHFAVGVGGALMVVSMPRASNVGMGWVQVRGGVHLVEPHLPPQG